MRSANVFLILLDISGYTRFLRHHAMSQIHAEEIVTELLEAVIAETGSPLVLNKLEGDAVFFYAEGGSDTAAVGEGITQQLLSCFTAFAAKLKWIMTAGTGGCPCEACAKAGQLRLKAVAHYGHAVLKRIRQFEELAGNDVILVHRLLKNSIPARQYLLVTEAFSPFCGPIPNHVSDDRTEYAQGVGALRVRAYYPAPLSEIPSAPAAPICLRGILATTRRWLRAGRRRLRGQQPQFRNIPGRMPRAAV